MPGPPRCVSENQILKKQLSDLRSPTTPSNNQDRRGPNRQLAAAQAQIANVAVGQKTSCVLKKTRLGNTRETIGDGPKQPRPLCQQARKTLARIKQLERGQGRIAETKKLE